LGRGRRRRPHGPGHDCRADRALVRKPAVRSASSSSRGNRARHVPGVERARRGVLPAFFSLRRWALYELHGGVGLTRSPPAIRQTFARSLPRHRPSDGGRTRVRRARCRRVPLRVPIENKLLHFIVLRVVSFSILQPSAQSGPLGVHEGQVPAAPATAVEHELCPGGARWHVNCNPMGWVRRLRLPD
jgi:hypothetical protein